MKSEEWAHDPDLAGINEMRIPPPEVSGFSEGDMKRDIKRVWSTLMLHLCRRYRENKRNGLETDYRIEELRTDHYKGYTDPTYFRELMRWMAKQFREEIEVEGDFIRLRRFGFDSCKKYDSTFQKDVDY